MCLQRIIDLVLPKQVCYILEIPQKKSMIDLVLQNKSAIFWKSPRKICLLITRTELETDWEGLMSPTVRSMGSKTRTYRQQRLASGHRTVGAGGTDHLTLSQPGWATHAHHILKSTNRGLAQSKRAGGIGADQNKAVQGGFFLKIDKCAGQIPIHVQDVINMQGEFFLKSNKRADQNTAMQGGFFFLKINKRACPSIRSTIVTTFPPGFSDLPTALGHCSRHTGLR